MHGESNGVLESLHKGSVARAKLMLALVRGVVSNQESDSALSLNFHKLLFKPGIHATWILSLSPNVPVQAVACLSVVSDYAGASRHCLAVKKFNGHAIESVLTKLLVRFRSEPLFPVGLEGVDFGVDSGSSE